MKPSCRSGTRLYEIWRGMKKRCEVASSKDYIDYGGRGIKICDEWSRSFTAFMDWAWDNGYSVDRSLDRIDVEKGYYPENCRWASAVEQITNTRETCKIYTSMRARCQKQRLNFDAGLNENRGFFPFRLNFAHTGILRHGQAFNAV